MFENAELAESRWKAKKLCELCVSAFIHRGGWNMYKQGCTWTCENCGYSYVE